MRHPKTVLVMTVLIVGNAAAALQAVTLPQPQERHDAAPDIPVSEHIAALLCDRGLEPEAAEAKSRQLFSGPVPTLSQLQRLSTALDGVELAMLEEGGGARHARRGPRQTGTLFKTGRFQIDRHPGPSDSGSDGPRRR